MRRLAAVITVLAIGGLIICLVYRTPHELFAANWTITPISVVAAAFANATAVGGGFLFVPVFVLGFGLGAGEAVRLSLATQAFGMTSGTLGWSKRSMDFRLLTTACLFSFAGVITATYYWVVPTDEIKSLFGWISILIGLAVIWEMRLGAVCTATRVGGDDWLKLSGLALCSWCGGLVTGWISIGVGEFVAIYLMLVYRLRITTAIGTGVATLAASSILGFALHTAMGGIRWDYLAFTAPGVIIGGFWGGRIGRWLGERHVDRQHLGNHSTSIDLPAPPSRRFRHSILKWVFVVIAVLDGIVMLIQAYRY